MLIENNNEKDKKKMTGKNGNCLELYSESNPW